MVEHSITLHNIRVYAYHGCLEQEAQIGSNYRIDISVCANFQKAIASDKLSDAIDYVHLNQIVKQEMAIRSELLEHVAGRIFQRIKSDFEQITKISVEIAKLNPPIGGDVESVSVKIIEQIVG